MHYLIGCDTKVTYPFSNLYILYNCDQKNQKHMLKDFQQNTGPVLLKDIKLKKNMLVIFFINECIIHDGFLKNILMYNFHYSFPETQEIQVPQVWNHQNGGFYFNE